MAEPGEEKEGSKKQSSRRRPSGTMFDLIFVRSQIQAEEGQNLRLQFGPRKKRKGQPSLQNVGMNSRGCGIYDGDKPK
ncbi:MAG: hypothetical protein HY093_05005 [Candidatus Liptonbacteria bacterium]|nr:hypothetical protein [Candidatus Liptonbacteria bacterium]